MADLRKFFSGLFSASERDAARSGPGPDVSRPNLQSLLMVSQSMAALRDLDEILNFLLGEIHQTFQLECGVLMMDETQTFKIRSHKGFTPGFVNAFFVPLGQGPIGESFALGKS